MTWRHTNGWAASPNPTPAERRAAELDALEGWAENMAAGFTLGGDVERAAYIEGAQSALADLVACIEWLRDHPDAAVNMDNVREALEAWACARCVEALREAADARDPLEAAHARGRAVAFDRGRTRFRQSPSPCCVHPVDGERG